MNPSTHQSASIDDGQGQGASIPSASLRSPSEIWASACIGREGYCSSDLQDAARTAIALAQVEALEQSAFVARCARLPEGYQWSESNRGKFAFGAERAAENIEALAQGMAARSGETGTGSTEGNGPVRDSECAQGQTP